MLARIKALFIAIQFSLTVGIVIIAMYFFKNKIHSIIKIWMKFQVLCLGIKIVEVGKLDESCDMVIMNHQSMLDIIIIEHLHSRHLAWVGKKEITDLFFFGHIMKMPDMISIDRENKSGLIKLINDSKDRIGKGRPIAMFPEGTRSNGEKLLKFKAGSSMVASKLELRVQPIILLNTRAILDSQNFKVNKGTVKIIYLEPVQAKRKTTWFEDTETLMNEVLQNELKKA